MGLFPVYRLEEAEGLLKEGGGWGSAGALRACSYKPQPKPKHQSEAPRLFKGFILVFVFHIWYKPRATCGTLLVGVWLSGNGTLKVGRIETLPSASLKLIYRTYLYSIRNENAHRNFAEPNVASNVRYIALQWRPSRYLEMKKMQGRK